MIGFRALGLGVALLGLGVGAAQAQYYPPGNGYPPGYGRPAPGYGYGPPPSYPQRPGFRCNATLPTPGGPRTVICQVRARPVGAPCHCPPPPPPPGYRWGPSLRGYMIP